MTSISAHRYRGEQDFEPLANFINICNEVDKLEQGTSVSELRNSYNSSNPEKIRNNVRIWRNTEDRVIGFSSIKISELSELTEGILHFLIHPDFRNEKLETQIIKWASLRLLEVQAQTNLPVKLRCELHEHDRYRTIVLENNGFIIDRHFFRLDRDLSLAIPDSRIPEGFKLLHASSEKDIELIVELYNSSFIDTWNFYPLTVEDLNNKLSLNMYREGLNLVILTPNEVFVTWLLCLVSSEANTRNSRNEGWIEFVTTRRDFRRRGLGREILLSALHKLKEVGLEVVRMCVDTENPSNALSLYESVGFSKVSTIVTCYKDIDKDNI